MTLLGAIALLSASGRDLPAGFARPAAATEATCVGDCDGNGAVTVDDVVTGVNIALGLTALASCTALDSDADGAVAVDELLRAVQAVLEGCPAGEARIAILSPASGEFTQADSILVAGRVTGDTSTAVVSVNGGAAELQPDGTFAAEIALDREAILNPVLAELTDTTDGFIDRDRIVVVAGDSVAAGEAVEGGVALRLTDAGLAKLQATLPDILDLDADSLIAPGTVVVNNYCIIDSPFGCIERVDVVAEAASVDSIAIDLDAVVGLLAVDVTLANLVVPLKVRGGVVDCGGRAAIERVRIFGHYELEPLPLDAASIDVNVVGEPVIEISGDSFEFTGGACDNDPIDDLIRAVVGDFRARLRSALTDYLSDPDGVGPRDAPVAAAMQSGLSAVDFTAPLGASFGIAFETTYASIDEDADGVTFGADALALAPPPAIPLSTASYRVEESFPDLPSTTPIAGAAFDVGLCVSTSTLNQMIKAVMETGGLTLDLTELDLGSGAVPLTAGTLALILPEARTLDPGLPIILRFRPTVAPILTGAPGPAGELADLRVAQLLLEVISDAGGTEVVHLRAALDARAAFDLVFDQDGRQLRIALTPPRPDEIFVTVLDDGLGVDETRLQANLPRVVAQFVTRLGSQVGAFDLPVLFGLQAGGVEISRAGQYPCMFLALEGRGLALSFGRDGQRR